MDAIHLELKIHRIGGVSILHGEPEGGGHAVGGRIGGLETGLDLEGDILFGEEMANLGGQGKGSGVGVVDGEEEGALRGEELAAGEEERFEFSIDAEGATAISVGEGGRIEDEGIELFLAAEKARKDAANVFCPEAVLGPTKIVPSIIFFAADETAGGGVDVKGFGTDGGGNEAEGAGVGEKIEKFGRAESSKVGAIFSLIGEKAWGDAWGEVDVVGETELVRFPSIAGA